MVKAVEKWKQGGVGIIIPDRGPVGWFGRQAVKFFLEPPRTMAFWASGGFEMSKIPTYCLWLMQECIPPLDLGITRSKQSTWSRAHAKTVGLKHAHSPSVMVHNYY